MVQVFHAATNTISRISILLVVLLLAASGWLIGAIVRSSYATQANVVRDQPVAFSHSHHVGQIGIDCRYCHASVEVSGFAGMPSTETCMGCHSQIWANSPMLEPVRASYRENEPIHWTRINDLPDFAYFNHSIHVAKGVGCSECHGRVDEMPLMWRAESLHMDWCLDCHRHPEPFVRPLEDVFVMDWPGGESSPSGSELVSQYGIEPATKLENCSICHR
jgi:hypothetical protein